MNINSVSNGNDASMNSGILDRTNRQELKDQRAEEKGEEANSESQLNDSLPEDKRKAIIQGIEKASGKIEIESKGLEFSIHEKTNQIMIKVIDNNTHEVIKEVPPEKILDMLANIIELSGLIVDERG